MKFTDTVSGKELIAANVGGDDAVDSDATDLGNNMSQIDGIVVTPGEETPDNDAGVEEPAGALSGRYFCDENRDGTELDDAGQPEAGVEGVLVALLDANGNPVRDADGAPITTTTGADGSYRFDDLAPGTYSVKFTDTVSGKELIAANVGGDDAVDSDATDLGNNMSQIDGIVVTPGEETPDNDAGVEEAAPGTAALGDTIWLDFFGNGVLDDFEATIRWDHRSAEGRDWHRDRGTGDVEWRSVPLRSAGCGHLVYSAYSSSTA